MTKLTDWEKKHLAEAEAAKHALTVEALKLRKSRLGKEIAKIDEQLAAFVAKHEPPAKATPPTPPVSRSTKSRSVANSSKESERPAKRD